MGQPYLPGFEKFVPGPLEVIKILRREGFRWLREYNYSDKDRMIHVPPRICFPGGRTLEEIEFEGFSTEDLKEKGFPEMELRLAEDFYIAMHSREALRKNYKFHCCDPFMNKKDEIECLDKYSLNSN